MAGDGRDSADRQRAAKAQWARDTAAKGRRIGTPEPPRDVARKNRGLDSLEAFARDYFPNRFYLPFSDDHRCVIGRLERCTNDGGQFCCAMPRGTGKTALAEVAVLRAVLYGLRRFVLLVGATEDLADKALARLMVELETNDRLHEDFQEATLPVRALERITRRIQGQVWDDDTSTRIDWTAKGITLATWPGSACAGAIVRVAGLTGALRGQMALTAAGEAIRPDLVVLDDVQTRESAKSPTQTADREAIVSDDVLGLAGPTTKIAAVNLCTVIYPNDLSDRFLSADKHPEWQGVRTRLVLSFPERMDLWDEYKNVLDLSLKEGDEGRRATALYAANREAMDAGGVVAWPERVKPGELSGLQSAMNVYLSNPRGFHAEYQNDPQADALAAGAKEFRPDDLAGRLAGTDRHQLPPETTLLTAGFDCQSTVLFYLVAAWNPQGGAVVVDYGAFPRQNRGHFAATDARPSLADVFPGHTESQLVYAGLSALTADVLGRTYYRAGAGEARVEKALVDSGWQASSVYQFVRASPSGAILYPSKGVGRSLTQQVGVGGWKSKPGWREGYHWRLTPPEKGRGRTLLFDPDPWKSLMHERLTTPLGSDGAIRFWGKSAQAHAMLSEHLAAEYSEPATLKGVTFDKWVQRPDRPDNHLFDCLVMAAVAASLAGLTWTATGRPQPPEPKRQPVSYAALQQQAKAAGSQQPGRTVSYAALQRQAKAGVR